MTHKVFIAVTDFDSSEYYNIDCLGIHCHSAQKAISTAKMYLKDASVQGVKSKYFGSYYNFTVLDALKGFSTEFGGV
jgi:hypothetical protein